MSMNVEDIYQHDAVAIGPFENLTTAAQLMREKQVSCLVVVEPLFDNKLKPVGVLTARDLAVSVIAREADSRSLRVADVMACDPLIAVVSDCVSAALRHMRQAGVRRVPVVGHSGELIGMLSLDDIVDALADEHRHAAAVINHEVSPRHAART
jgi:CBS domain-containing protein